MRIQYQVSRCKYQDARLKYQDSRPYIRFFLILGSFVLCLMSHISRLVSHILILKKLAKLYWIIIHKLKITTKKITMETKFGYMGRILWVDLTHGKFRDEDIPDEVYEQFLSGYGLASKVISAFSSTLKVR